jgi:hypothetical protein
VRLRQVKTRNHDKDQQKALRGREIFPVGRDEKQYAGGDHD